mmetsp:Transcript_25540/g.28378  ORF Transcript_25540/g.28378 Transcript_25540/m.28378 type:complete len:214 (+) Transcript_25540:59-700(+)|eukprot:CAMPEP_0205820004 /NCGR_PEP_ID=MMETSP0206-20130828/2574_1 /ASSEMBLY_ACC=CAM_ASM_000279 /TAXON_ID=36767 /ORGANISM="Euplotes focardii, Strain TN1" /LENGTH=213 /DNA_ID=CAMNT_0053114281 /DNA_START=58 /DNA_END=699 /DNA_ORIENTATION=-
MVKFIIFTLLFVYSFGKTIDFSICDPERNLIFATALGNGFKIGIDVFRPLHHQEHETLICAETEGIDFINSVGAQTFGFQVICDSEPGQDCETHEQYKFMFVGSKLSSVNPITWEGNGYDISEFGLAFNDPEIAYPHTTFNLTQEEIDQSHYPAIEMGQYKYFSCFSDLISGRTGSLSETLTLDDIELNHFNMMVGGDFKVEIFPVLKEVVSA